MRTKSEAPNGLQTETGPLAERGRKQRVSGFRSMTWILFALRILLPIVDLFDRRTR